MGSLNGDMMQVTKQQTKRRNYEEVVCPKVIFVHKNSTYFSA